MVAFSTINETSRAQAGTCARLSPQCNLLMKGHIMANSHPIPTAPHFQDLTGKTFGQLEVLSYHGIVGKHSKWNCRCKCGRVVSVKSIRLTRGKAVTCEPCVAELRAELYEQHLTERFLKSIRITDSGCWEWQKSRWESGYGKVGVYRQIVAAHIVSYRLFRGPIADGLFVCHECDNPPCVNPDHLFLGTHQQNMDDMVAKGRQTRGVLNSHAKITEDQVQEIRHLYAAGGMTQKDIGARFGITKSNVHLIVCGLAWKHVAKS